MALVLKRRIPSIRRRNLRRSNSRRSIEERIKRAWESPETYEPQI
ncbi:MAG: hypothetical protein QFX35_01080 [Candidatus Verstraetearchaeota archaeon]|nr:hypothetical protein [Candidatus Verstraetearchaeota archaeon]